MTYVAQWPYFVAILDKYGKYLDKFLNEKWNNFVTFV